jgi:hypothetical protein
VGFLLIAPATPKWARLGAVGDGAVGGEYRLQLRREGWRPVALHDAWSRMVFWWNDMHKTLLEVTFSGADHPSMNE